MLSDFLMLEEFFGRRAGALFIEDAARHYSEMSVKKAMLAGDVVGRRIVCGPDRGRLLLWLSHEGRKKARHIRLS